MFRRFYLLLVLAGILVVPASVAAQDSPVEPAVTIHVVQRGETLFRIAQHYGLNVADLAALNSISDPSSLMVGQTLLVPSGSSATGSRSLVHIVQAGESLNSIAHLYQVDAMQLAMENSIDGQHPLYVGQALRVPLAAAEPAASPPTDVPPIATQEPQGVLHTITSGETLFRIAQRYGVTVAAIAAANGIADPSTIYAGQQLLIPGVQPPQLATGLPAPVQSLTVDPLILVEGETGRFRLTAAAPVQVSGVFMDHPLVSASEQNGLLHTILVGVPIFTAPGIYPLTLTVTDASGIASTVSANIQVVNGGYGSEYINVLAGREDLLDPNVENAELALLQGVMGVFTPTRFFSGPMSLPAAATIISPFGTRRSYNGGGFDRFHAGTDFAGAPGTPVMAAAPGVVVLADTLNVRGNAIVIDHGWGVFTGYWHQSELYVQPGDRVETGQVIGTIGATGRVTGAHLHWELWVNGVPVDPMQWVSQSFS